MEDNITLYPITTQLSNQMTFVGTEMVDDWEVRGVVECHGTLYIWGKTT